MRVCRWPLGRGAPAAGRWGGGACCLAWSKTLRFAQEKREGEQVSCRRGGGGVGKLHLPARASFTSAPSRRVAVSRCARDLSEPPRCATSGTNGGTGPAGLGRAAARRRRADPGCCPRAQHLDEQQHGADVQQQHNVDVQLPGAAREPDFKSDTANSEIKVVLDFSAATKAPKERERVVMQRNCCSRKRNKRAQRERPSWRQSGLYSCEVEEQHGFCLCRPLGGRALF